MQFFNIIKAVNRPNAKEKEKKGKISVANPLGIHTELQKVTRQAHSISQITFRAINVNGLGENKKRE